MKRSPRPLATAQQKQANRLVDTKSVREKSYTKRETVHIAINQRFLLIVSTNHSLNG